MPASTDHFGKLRPIIAALVGLSLFTNLAVLISPIYMMQVLDRVIPSGNTATLLLLLALAMVALATNGYVDYCRDMTLGRAARWLDEACTTASLSVPDDSRQQAVDDTAALRNLLSGQTPVTALSLPWLPLFVLALFLIHPGFVALVAVLGTLLLAIRLIGDWLGRPRQEAAAALEQKGTGTLRDIATAAKLGGHAAAAENLTADYINTQGRKRQLEEDNAPAQNAATAAGAFLRMASQLFALSLGAYLVVGEQLTAGGMIGASIIATKTLVSLEGAITTVPALRQGWAAMARLRPVLRHRPPATTEIEELSGALRCENLVYPRGGGAEPRLSRVSFTLDPGECLAIVGDSGSGKTTLLAALSGQDRAPIGAVFLDDSEVGTLGPQSRRAHIGYLPQQAKMLDGTIAQNICSFAPDPDDDRIVEAAKIAGVHGLISGLPASYDTDIGQHPFLLSAGQKQRVALARAIHDKPRYLFLDEPNSLLDANGERQLCDTLTTLKSQGVTIVMVLHRSGIMGIADQVMMMEHGRVADFGPRAEVLSRQSAGQRRLTLPATTAALQDLADWISAQFLRSTDEAFQHKTILAASEMFNLACTAAPEATGRKLTFQFKFATPNACQITLADPVLNEVEAKLPRVKSILQTPDVDLIDVDGEEMALAVVVQLCERFEARNTDDMSIFNAFLASERANAAPGMDRARPN